MNFYYQSWKMYYKDTHVNLYVYHFPFIADSTQQLVHCLIMPECHVCNGKDFEEHDGLFYCTECQTQSQVMQCSNIIFTHLLDMYLLYYYI